MPNNKRKSAKDVQGERIHPYSRKATQLHRSDLRNARVKKTKAESGKLQNSRVDRFMWFKDACDGDLHFNLEKVRCFIEQYIARNDDELAAMLDDRVKRSRPPSSRELLLQGLKARDQAEYGTGFHMPDLTDPVNVEKLVNWGGDHNNIQQFKTVHVVK